MSKLRLLLKKIHTPRTIMLVPNSRFSSRSIRIPLFAAETFCALTCMGAVSPPPSPCRPWIITG